MLQTIWDIDGKVMIIDQTLLPLEEKTVELKTVPQMWDAICRLCVRGAPAIGIAAAYGIWLSARNCQEPTAIYAQVLQDCDYLATSRPTAVNLFWALDRMKALVVRQQENNASASQLQTAILEEARTMTETDHAICRAIGRHGAALLRDGMTILTHCNAGGLATAGVGTALAPVYWATEHENKNIRVFADETRPLLQGARLTAWELQKSGIDVTLICDNMAAMVMGQGKIDAVIVGTDRVAANGDFANKIGTYGVAVLAHHHGIPLYVAAPFSSVDLNTPNGAGIPIEERAAEEVCEFGAKRTAPYNTKIYNPAFDVTPAKLVTAFITEHGVLYPPFNKSLKHASEA